MGKEKLLINIFGCPKAGKTTLMAHLFVRLKLQDIYVEMATDFAKEVLFEKRFSILENQLYILAKQEKRISELYKFADVVITDCPVLHSLVYNADNYKTLHPFILEIHRKYNSLNLFVRRTREIKYGSFKIKSPEEICKIETEIEDMLITNDIRHFLLYQTPKMLEMASDIMFIKIKEIRRE